MNNTTLKILLKNSEDRTILELAHLIGFWSAGYSRVTRWGLMWEKAMEKEVELRNEANNLTQHND